MDLTWKQSFLIIGIPGVYWFISSAFLCAAFSKLFLHTAYYNLRMTNSTTSRAKRNLQTALPAQFFVKKACWILFLKNNQLFCLSCEKAARNHVDENDTRCIFTESYSNSYSVSVLSIKVNNISSVFLPVDFENFEAVCFSCFTRTALLSAFDNFEE